MARTRIAVVPGNTFIDDNIVSGKNYYYWLKAVDTTGNKSDYSVGTFNKVVAITDASQLILPVCDDASVYAGAWVNIYSTLLDITCVRLADASEIGKEAHGFVLEDKNGGDLVTVYLPGNINYHARRSDVGTGIPDIGGYAYLTDNMPGAYSMAPPSGSGHFIQKLGLPIISEET